MSFITSLARLTLTFVAIALVATACGGGDTATAPDDNLAETTSATAAPTTMSTDSPVTTAAQTTTTVAETTATTAPLAVMFDDLPEGTQFMMNDICRRAGSEGAATDITFTETAPVFGNVVNDGLGVPALAEAWAQISVSDPPGLIDAANTVCAEIGWVTDPAVVLLEFGEFTVDVDVASCPLDDITGFGWGLGRQGFDIVVEDVDGTSWEISLNLIATEANESFLVATNKLEGGKPAFLANSSKVNGEFEITETSLVLTTTFVKAVLQDEDDRELILTVTCQG